MVTLKEQGLNARRVVAIAEREDVPVMVDVPLAQSLMSDANINQYIPNDLIAPVAEVLRLVPKPLTPARGRKRTPSNSILRRR